LFQSEVCERAYFTRSQGVCLVLNRTSMQPRGFVYFLNPQFQTVSQLPLAGLPIRARISPDERYAATTVFVTGENYASEDFTTRTTIYDLDTRTAIVDLERFTVERNGAPFRQTDFNFWGVTFRADGNRFLATLGTGGHRLLVDGDLQRRHFRVIADDVECPSLSPDQHTIVFKRQKARGAGWQLWGMDLASGQSWPVTEDGRQVDDQVEWLDESHVVYGHGGQPGTSRVQSQRVGQRRAPRRRDESGCVPEIGVVTGRHSLKRSHMKNTFVIVLSLAVLAMVMWPSAAQEGLSIPAPAVDLPPGSATSDTAVFAGGCFWVCKGSISTRRVSRMRCPVMPAAPPTPPTTSAPVSAIRGTPSRCRSRSIPAR
jgi:hypothetical protein